MKKLLGILFLLSLAGVSVASDKMNLTCELPYNDIKDRGKVEVILDFSDWSIKEFKVWVSSSDRAPIDYINRPMKVSSKVYISDDNMKITGNVRNEYGSVNIVEFLPLILNGGISLDVGTSHENNQRIENCIYKNI